MILAESFPRREQPYELYGEERDLRLRPLQLVVGAMYKMRLKYPLPSESGPEQCVDYITRLVDMHFGRYGYDLNLAVFLDAERQHSEHMNPPFTDEGLIIVRPAADFALASGLRELREMGYLAGAADPCELALGKLAGQEQLELKG